ncbi:MAG: preprotein translocase subunit SecE [Ruminococcus sp.]|nr:preprotein translocase subunit SecE [Ruminococcus sp.]
MSKKADSKGIDSSSAAQKARDASKAEKKAAKKKAAAAAKTKDKSKEKKKKGGIRKYFRDLKSEIKKVVWPSRSKVVNNSGVVLVVIIAVGLFLFGVDSLLGVGVNALLSIGTS